MSDWAEEVTVDSNCYLRTEKFVLYGPLRKRDSRLDSVPTKAPIFIFDQKYDTPNLDHNTNDMTSVLCDRKPVTYKRFDANRVNNYLTLDSKTITTVVDSIYTYANDIDEKLNDLTINKQNTKHFISWQSAINTITKICLFYSTTFIVITLIRMSFGFYGIAPIIITELDSVEGKFIKTRNHVEFWQFISGDPFNTHQLHYCRRPYCSLHFNIPLQTLSYSSTR